IPTLCDDPRLKPVGACRMCLVHVEGVGREVTSCMATVSEGVNVATHTPELEEAREMNLRMLARHYPADAFESDPEKPFHRIARKYGLTAGDFSTNGHNRRTDNSHTYIRVDMSRCIDCYNCVRICDEVQG